MTAETRDVRITDTTLRDGSHALAHQFTVEHARAVAAALDRGGVPVLEVSHGDGLGGSSFNYGFSRTDERKLIRTAVESVERAKVAALLLPGVGTKDDIAAVAELGVSVVRIATHCTEADISEQHFGLARDAGMETVGFLMLAHMVDPDVLAKQARVMVDAGCQCVYVVDSAGALLLEQVSDRISALLDEVGDETQVGFHGHRNLGLAEANSVLAIRAGAKQIDGCLRGLGAGAGNTPTEVLAAVCERLGVRTGIDLFTVLDAAEEIVRPIMEAECALDRLSVTMGYSGVYSSFLKHARRAAERYGVPDTELIVRAGERRLVGGQEDQLIDIALEVLAEREGRRA